MYSRVVGEGGVDPGYFLDIMSLSEVNLFLGGLSVRNRDAWEQTRMVCYIIAQANSSKTLKQSDILRFPWDDSSGSEIDSTSVSDEDMRRLRELAKQYESNNK